MAVLANLQESRVPGSIGSFSTYSFRWASADLVSRIRSLARIEELKLSGMAVWIRG